MMIRTMGCTTALVLLLAPTLTAQERDTAETRLRGGDVWQTDFSRRAVPSAEIISGGPPKDGIPALDKPRFERAASAAKWLEEREPVMVVENGGNVKAYPLGILIWHEIVNDQVGGLPVSVTFCPLCNTALVFDRRLDGRVLDFGTTGRLRHSDLVMYDRQTETWWQQATGDAIVGELVGNELQRFPSSILSWETARKLHPGLLVLSRNTGYQRDYGRNPYVGYDDRSNRPLRNFFSQDTDPRLPAMERVAALELGRGWAVAFEALSEERVVNAEAAGTPFVVFWEAGTASALDRREIASGRDVGQTASFDRRVEGQLLSFRATKRGFQDEETGSLWDFAGRATAGTLAGKRLRPLPHGNHFWFAWVTFRPEAVLWEG